MSGLLAFEWLLRLVN